MKLFFAKLSLAALFALVIFPAFADEEVTFEANSPLTVSLGGAFRVEFALNAKPDGGTFEAPAFEGFDVLAGPAESTGSSIQIINGSMTKSVSHTYTFVLLPQAAGTVTIGAATVKVDGKVYRTQPLPIEVVDEAARSNSSRRGGVREMRAAPRLSTRSARMIFCCGPSCRARRSTRTNRFT